MSLKPEEIDELLNGMLDGVLTDDEQRRVDAALERDPSLQARLDEMAALRRSLLRGRSVGRLGPDFAKRIVLAARERADLMDDPPGWIKPQIGTKRTELSPSRDMERSRPSTPHAPGRANPDAHGSSFPAKSRSRQRIRGLLSSQVDALDEGATQSNDLRRRAMRVWIPGLLAVTAASAAVLFLSTLLSPPNPNGDLIVVVPDGGASGSPRSDSQDGGEGINGLGTTILGNPGSIAQGTQQLPDSSTIEGVPEVPDTDANPSLVTERLDRDPMLAGKAAMDSQQPIAAAPEPPVPSATDPMLSLPDVKPENGLVQTPLAGSSGLADPTLTRNSNPSDPLTQKLIEQFGVGIFERMKFGKPYFTMVLNVQADSQAVRDKAIEGLLEKYEMTYANDLALDDEQLNILVNSGCIGAVASGSDMAQEGGVQVYFIRGEAWRITEFFLDIQGQYLDFPFFRLDLTYDLSVLELEDQLSGISDPSNRVAHRLEFKRSKTDGDLSMVVGARLGEPLGLQERLAAIRDPLTKMQIKRTETSYMLLIVRNPSE